MQKIDETFQNDINAVWTRKLIGEFYYICNTIERKLCKTLKDPNFAYNYDNTKWGSWDASSRTITLSYELLRNCEWDDVVYTLKHEVAHVIVTEIFMKEGVSDNNQMHGELFDKACKVLGIDGVAKWRSDKYHIPEKEKILSRIYKLFCLGESNYKAEAEAAVNKAHELMVKYNVSLQELPKERRSFICRPVGYAYKKVPEYIKTLARTISHYYFVKYIYMHWGRRGHYIELYGEPHNVDIAEYIFHFLIHEGERQWKEFQKTPEYLARFNEGRKRYYYSGKESDYKERRKGWQPLTINLQNPTNT